VKLKWFALAVAAIIAWRLKRHYADARVEDLEWILQPTAQLVGLVTGTAFVAVPGEGYVSHARLFVIEKSCAGVNFMIAAFALVVLARVNRIDSWMRGATTIAASLAISYGAAILVNTVRITIALWLTSRPPALSVSAAQLHRIEGIVVYFVALLVLHEILRRLDRRQARVERFAVPLGCYYGMTLLVPLANGAGQSGHAFVEHAVVVATVPLVLIALGWAGRRLVSSRSGWATFVGAKNTKVFSECTKDVRR
jgi:exosortase K